MADDHSADAEGMDRAEDGGWETGGRDLARPPGAGSECRENPEHLKILEDGCAAINRKNCSTRREVGGGARRTGAEGPAADGHESACERRVADEGFRCPTFENYAVEVKKPGRQKRSDPRAGKVFCGT